MAGHNKWSKIKHRKAAVEKKKTKIWSKCSRAIMVAARHGGPDPDSNITLRYAVEEARYANMPKDTIQRAIDKGAGAGAGDAFENVTYEGYGPGGVAIVVEGLTDNRARTAGDVRLAFSDSGGALGATGCVAHVFRSVGRIIVPGAGMTEERLMDLAIEAGADDVIPPEPGDDDEPAPFEVHCAPTALMAVRRALEAAGVRVELSELTKIAADTVPISAEQAETLADLVDALEDNDDVQRVYTNARVD
ncbi:MAG: YebC/PmpR family DNA-binding transcriptional regulator [Phycisphaerales bacterium]|nr:YebC/PmpR family DNA-binding transcriptional regulator [Phycisphaerales bacterium]